MNGKYSTRTAYSRNDPRNPAKNCPYTAKHHGSEGENPLTSDQWEYTEEELEFLKAIDAYKRQNSRPHPSWHEVLKVIRSLGYRKV